MNNEPENSALNKLDGWEIFEEDGLKKLKKGFQFKNFAEALKFTNEVGTLAEEHDHHPAILTEWGSVTITWWTHTANGVTQNDYKMASRVDDL